MFRTRFNKTRYNIVVMFSSYRVSVFRKKKKIQSQLFCVLNSERNGAVRVLLRCVRYYFFPSVNTFFFTRNLVPIFKRNDFFSESFSELAQNVFFFHFRCSFLNCSRKKKNVGKAGQIYGNFSGFIISWFFFILFCRLQFG